MKPLPFALLSLLCGAAAIWGASRAFRWVEATRDYEWFAEKYREAQR